MAISPTRAFALGACSVILVAGVFVAGIGVGAHDDRDPKHATRPLAEKVSCPGSPGFTATRAENERAANCEHARHVQELLLASGATDANASVTSRATGELLGPESVIEVVAQVDLPLDVRGDWDPAAVAATISRELGTTTEHVTITDERLRTLFDGARTGPGTSPALLGPTSTARPTSARPR